MANILISYGDQRYYESVRRVIRHAKKTPFFNRVRMYTENDIPEDVKKSPLFQYARGGGYWLWKPWIILDALKNSAPNDVVVYVDGGCGLNPQSKEWNYYKEELKSHSAIIFQYRDAKTYTFWKPVCTSADNYSSKIRYWSKPLCREFLTSYFGGDDFLEYNSVWCGACIVKNCLKGMAFVQEWFDLMNKHPEIVRDMEGSELNNIPLDFNAHRHDQSIVTGIVFYRMKDLDLRIIPETSESQKDTAAIRADRFIQAKMPFWQNLKYKIYTLLHGDI